MTGEYAFIIAFAALGIGIIIGVVLWICVIKPRIESSSRDNGEATTTDLRNIQEEAERVKTSALHIQERVTRLQQLTRARELAEEQRRAQEGKEND